MIWYVQSVREHRWTIRGACGFAAEIKRRTIASRKYRRTLWMVASRAPASLRTRTRAQRQIRGGRLRSFFFAFLIWRRAHELCRRSSFRASSRRSVVDSATRGGTLIPTTFYDRLDDRPYPFRKISPFLRCSRGVLGVELQAVSTRVKRREEIASWIR